MNELKNYGMNIYQKDPFGLFLILSRYKFAGRLVKKSDAVVDLGCGRGIGTTFIASFCKEVIGIDCREENIEEAAKKNQRENVSYCLGDATDFSSERKFNVVVSLDVIEHMSKNDAHAMLKTIGSLLEDDGFAIIGTPNIKSSEYASAERNLDHVHEYSYEEFRQVLEARFKRVIIFSMTDEAVNTSFNEMAWYFMALCF